MQKINDIFSIFFGYNFLKLGKIIFRHCVTEYIAELKISTLTLNRIIIRNKKLRYLKSEGFYTVKIRKKINPFYGKITTIDLFIALLEDISRKLLQFILLLVHHNLNIQC